MVAAFAATAGCTVPLTFSANRSSAEPVAITPQDWRLPSAPVLERIAAETPDEFAVDGPDQLPTQRIFAKVVNPGGVLRAWELTEAGERLRDERAKILGEGIWTDIFLSFRPNGTFLSAGWIAREGPRGLIAADAMDPEYKLPGVKLTEGLDLRIPSAEDCAEAKGLILHLPAMMPTKYEEGLLEHLKADGWAFAHLDVSIRAVSPTERDQERVVVMRRRAVDEMIGEWVKANPPEEIDGIRRPKGPPYQTMREFYLRSKALHPDFPTGFELTGDADPSAVGQTIALAADEQLAAHAFAADAIIEATMRLRPELADKPVVILGCSAGSMFAPVVAAKLRERLGQRLAAVALIGGGADILTLTQGSTMSDGGIELAPEGEKPDRKLYASALAEYRAATTLDREETALAFADVPVLHHYALFDEFVPTKNARILNARIQNLDTLVHIGGHKTLFYFLSQQHGRICSWINARAFPD